MVWGQGLRKNQWVSTCNPQPPELDQKLVTPGPRSYLQTTLRLIGSAGGRQVDFSLAGASFLSSATDHDIALSLYYSILIFFEEDVAKVSNRRFEESASEALNIDAHKSSLGRC